MSNVSGNTQSVATASVAPRRVLVDTNVLLRAADSQSSAHHVAQGALKTLTATGAELCVTPQVLIEFRVVVTRPVSSNGLGWPSVRAVSELTQQKAAFAILPDTPHIFSEWERLSDSYSVSGKQCHDCRLIAVRLTHGVLEILTFNMAHFRRYEAAEGITIIDPANVPAQS